MTGGSSPRSFPVARRRRKPKHPLARGEHFVPYSFVPEVWTPPKVHMFDATTGA